MSFGENLQRYRKERRLSQEALAEMLGVSRQAVSKWEQGSYPETEKLLALSRALHVSLDSLMADEAAPGGAERPERAAGTITISSPHAHVIAKCCKVTASPRFKGGRDAPHYALFAAGDGGGSGWGVSNTFLAWYADAEPLEKEIAAIEKALLEGVPAYQLQYSVKVERKFLRLKIVDAQG